MEAWLSMETDLKKIKDIKSNVKQSKGYKRLSMLFDNAIFNELDPLVKSEDTYSEVISGFGYVNSCPVYAFSQNIDANGSPVSKAQISKILKVYKMAEKMGIPVVGFYDSIGAKLKEGNEMLSLYGELLQVSNNISGVVPQISVILGKCFGTSSMIAAASDILIMTEKSQFGIDVSGENSSAEFIKKSGISHITTQNEEEAIVKTKNIIAMLPSNNLETSPDFESIVEPSNIQLKTELDVVKIFDADSFIELQNGFGQAFIVGLARLDGKTVGAIISNSDFNDGIIDADSCTKSARLVRFCDAFSIPLLTFINSKGFSSLKEASKLSSSYSEATTAKITVIVGEVYGPLYVSIAGKGANADIILSWPESLVSMLSPETEVAIMCQESLKGSKNPIKDREELVAEYKNTKASAIKAANEGFIDEIIEPNDTREKLISYLDMLSSKRVSTLPKKHSNIQI